MALGVIGSGNPIQHVRDYYAPNAGGERDRQLAPTSGGPLQAVRDWADAGRVPAADPYAGIGTSPFGNTFQSAINNQQHRNNAAQYAGNFRGALDFYNNFNAPTIAEHQAKLDRGNMNVGGILANQSVQSNSLQGNYDNAVAKLGLQREGLGIDRNAAGRAITNADVLQELANQMFGVQTTEAWQSADQSRRAANSSATARGAMSAPGIGRTQQDITNNLANTNNKIGINKAEAKVGFDEQRASAKDRQSQIDLLTKGLGLDESTLKNNLEASLSGLGLDTMMSVNDVFDMIGSTNINMNQLGIQILQEAFNAAGMGIDFKAMFPGLGAGMQQPRVPGAGGMSPEDRGIR